MKFEVIDYSKSIGAYIERDKNIEFDVQYSPFLSRNKDVKVYLQNYSKAYEEDFHVSTNVQLMVKVTS